MAGGSSARWYRSFVLIACVLLAAGLLTSCTAHSTAVVPHPYRAPAIGPPPTALLPAGKKTAVRVTAVSANMDRSNDLLWGADRQIGPAYQFAVAKEPSSAVISFRVDPGKLASAVGVAHARPDGLYVQIFEPALGSWIPLRSVYHAASHTVTAGAPHLSLVSLSWSDVACVVTCPAAAFAKVIKHFGSDVIGGIKEAWSPTQEPDDCPSDADKNWSVRSTITKLTGCVVTSSVSPVVQVENPLLLPMTIRQPPGAPYASITRQPWAAGLHPELSTFMTGLLDWAGDASVIAPRSYGIVPLQDLSKVGAVTMATQPDALGLVIDVILGVLVALPGEKSKEAEIDDAVKAVLPELVQKMTEHPGSVSFANILDAVEGSIQKQAAAGQGVGLTFVQTFADAYECATDKLEEDVTKGMQDGGITNGFIGAAADLAKNCVETAFKELGKELRHPFEDVLKVIDGIPNFGKTIREGVQFAELGPSAILAATTAERVPYDLTGRPFFQTPDGNITCGLPLFHWSADVPAEPADISQDLLCRITKHTVPPADCRNLQFEAAPGVSMEPPQYASFTCVGMETDKLMYFQPADNGGLGPPRVPYHAQNGQNVNLGPVTCFVQTSSVDCTSTRAPRTFHLDQNSFRSPLSPGDSVMAAQNQGSPYIPASTAVVRPSTYQYGEDSQFSAITWNQWDATMATGTATDTFNTCTPDCAAGHLRIDKNVTIMFKDPMIVCGQWFFTKFTVIDPAAPAGSGSVSIAPDSYNSETNPDCLPPSNG